MFKEHLQPIAKGILTASVRSENETMFRTFTMTCEMIAASKTLGCEAIAFLQTECKTLMGVVHILEMSVIDVAKKIFRIYEMVARIYITIMLNN